MKFVIVTGMSGAGKSTALKMLEDMGYFCVDNLPIPLLSKFAELAHAPGSDITQVALGVDIRNGRSFGELASSLECLKNEGVSYEILFLDARDDVLVKRYKETRRAHPLAKEGRVEDGLLKEREMLVYLKKHADYILDTSQLLTRELKKALEKILVGDKNFKNLIITVLSFGFKYGIPKDSDLVFDVRCLPNPFYVPELKHHTGLEEPVRDYVMKFDQSRGLVPKLLDLINYLVPLYRSEGKSQLTISVGCTGGKHRSVVFAELVYKDIKEKGYNAATYHRDINR